MSKVKQILYAYKITHSAEYILQCWACTKILGEI